MEEEEEEEFLTYEALVQKKRKALSSTLLNLFQIHKEIEGENVDCFVCGAVSVSSDLRGGTGQKAKAQLSMGANVTQTDIISAFQELS
ncbi:hypothetical protein QYF36_018688 [Acer negundo]|nr:hypothetical protein QYF36_018688 [Acer negundo]